MAARARAWLATAISVACVAGGGLIGIASEQGVAAAATPVYHLAMGDSLAAGAGASPASNSYVNRVYQHELGRFPGLTLANISCGGASTGSVLNGPNCGNPVTQIATAENFLHAHPGQVSFVTIDIGGNDVSGCIGAGGVNATCVANATAAIQTNLPTILSRLNAAYPGIRVYGMTYYIPHLAFWLTGASGQQVATDAVPLGDQFNTMLTQIYAASGFRTANVAGAFDNNNMALTGVYLGQTVPQNVANLCNWTLQCSVNDVHANNTGHGKLADAFAAVIDLDPAPGALAISTAGLPAGQIGTAYLTRLTATGGTAPYRWKRIGKLPKGLKLFARTGVITGIPKKLTGNYAFQIRVYDKAKPKSTATKWFSISIT